MIASTSTKILFLVITSVALCCYVPLTASLQVPTTTKAIRSPSSRKIYEKSRLVGRSLGAYRNNLPSSQISANLDISKEIEKGIVVNNADDRLKPILAKSLGYVMAVGAMVIYTPILIKISKQGSAAGFSVSTWIFNIIGLSLSIAYPMKKGFPFSTYMELVGACCQSIGILGLLCHYTGRFSEYLLGVAGLMTSFIILNWLPNVSQSYLNLIQIAAAVTANYANVPQILLTFQTRKATWSWISATMSLAGCLIRVFTTLQLTKDKLVLFGYILGVITNSILLLQIYFFR